VLLDVSPLRRHRDFALLFTGQFVSGFGTFFTYVALPVQIYDLTKSSAIVGLLGTVQLVPLAIAALWGGAFADAIDRRRLLVWCEALMLLGAVGLVLNSLCATPSVTVLFALAAFLSAVNGFHRPALEAMTPKLVTVEELPAVSALSALRRTISAVAGPALAGICIATFGLPFTYGIDVATFAISLLALAAIRAMPPPADAPRAGLASIVEGLRYATRRPELIGTYLVDIVAMVFAMPTAVFPALAEQLGGSAAVGFLYSSMSVGAFVVTLFSKWTASVERRGAAVVISALLWGIAIFALGFAHTLPLAVLCLALAGAADMVSALFRMTIWNETIPSVIRGRMAAIEQLSYMTGPLIGNARAGYMAERFGLGPSIVWGGILCTVCVAACIPLLPSFWRYRKSEHIAPDAAAAPKTAEAP
jgi:MFS family permease